MYLHSILIFSSGYELSVVMHDYVGISVTWEDLGSCPVICPVFDNQDRKSVKVLCGFNRKPSMVYCRSSHRVILVWEY